MHKQKEYFAPKNSKLKSKGNNWLDIGYLHKPNELPV